MNVCLLSAFTFEILRNVMPLEVIKAICLEDFWELISPIGRIAQDMAEPIFRGQGDSSWSLNPAVNRQDIIERYGSRTCLTSLENVLVLECLILSDFLQCLDDMGLNVPGDSPKFRKYVDYFEVVRLLTIDQEGWPSELHYPFLALAQHHGIPTRLLDWSRSPFVAAYFSASQAIGLNVRPTHLAVWIYDAQNIGNLARKFDVVRVPGSTSINLAAQKGLFLLAKSQQTNGGYQSGSPEKEETFDQYLDMVANQTLYKITLSADLAGELLIRCSKFGVSAATLYPGFDGAAKAALEYRLAQKAAGFF